MKNIKLKWRLSKLPTPSELVELVNNKIVTQEEAKEILLDQQTEEDINTDALKAEIKFLRQVVEDLSKSKTETVKVIEKHINHYRDWTWCQPYTTYCSIGNSSSGTGGSFDLTSHTGTNNLTGLEITNAVASLNDLKTF